MTEEERKKFIRKLIKELIDYKIDFVISVDKYFKKEKKLSDKQLCALIEIHQKYII